MHWHQDGGQLFPAGVEVRCYGVEDDNEDDFWAGQMHPRHELPLLDDGERTRGASSELLTKRVKWGPVLGEHAAKLSRKLAESADETQGLHPGSAAFMRQAAALAGGLPRANDATYQLVAALYLEAMDGRARSRPAMYVMEQLIEAHGYALDPDIESHRVKVRQWIARARDLEYLPKTTANTERKERK